MDAAVPWGRPVLGAAVPLVDFAAASHWEDPGTAADSWEALDTAAPWADPEPKPQLLLSAAAVGLWGIAGPCTYGSAWTAEMSVSEPPSCYSWA